MYFTFSVARHLIFSSTRKRNTSFGFSELRQFLYGGEAGWGGLGSQALGWEPKGVTRGVRERGEWKRDDHEEVQGCKSRAEAFPHQPRQFWPIRARWDYVGKCLYFLSAKYPPIVFFGCILR